ncbi:hypothetical protein LSCM4_07767 [Leishmania orientalis]|uniref:Uncharacterized protein n=1 Tax=Leishmania orientalis TaxID=2249476 RepID=A0A836HTF5_9TRYP|nr:hypothetical protein LSCM4_07767 [Leishmania orientalis]
MGCAGSKTKRKQNRQDTTSPATIEAVISRPSEPRGDRVNEWLNSTSRANAGGNEDELDAQSPGRASDVTAEGKSALGATLPGGALDGSAHAALATADVEAKPQLDEDAAEETDGVSKSLGAATQSSPISRPASPQPQLTEKAEAGPGSLVHSEVESCKTAKEAVADEVEVELSPLYSLPPAESDQPPAPAPAPYDAEAAQLPETESVPRPESTRESPHSPLLPPEGQKLPRVRASQSSNTSASSRRSARREERLAASAAPASRRHSLKASISDSLSLNEQASRWPAQRQALQPSVHSGSSPPARQHRTSLAAAILSPQQAARRDGYRDAAAAPLSPSASSWVSVTPVPQKALVPAGALSERMAARSRRAASGREAASSLLDMRPSRYRESPVDQSTPLSEQPLQPTPARWQRGFISPIPYRQGYTNPAPGADPLTHRPLTTYMPPPTAYIIGSAGSAPPRLLLRPSAMATVEASTTKLLQSHTLHLSGAHAGAAAMTGSGRESEASAPISQRFAAPWMSAPLAPRLAIPKAGPSVYQELMKLRPSSAADSLLSRSSQQLRYAASESRAQQQRYLEDIPPSEHHTSCRSSMRAGAPANRAADNYNLGVGAASVDGSYDAEQELTVYEQQYCNVQEPREESVATYEPSTTDDVPTNAAVLLPTGLGASSSSMLRYPWHGGSEAGEDEGA